MAEARDAQLPSFGRFRALSALASGGMAEIFRAEQRVAGDVSRRVVLRVMLPPLSREAAYRTMFLDEARLASRLQHPHIVHVLDFGEEDGRSFLAMEYLAGETLFTILRQSLERGRFVPVQVVLT